MTSTAAIIWFLLITGNSSNASPAVVRMQSEAACRAAAIQINQASPKGMALKYAYCLSDAGSFVPRIELEANK
jgi:hypothetical protein